MKIYFCMLKHINKDESDYLYSNSTTDDDYGL